MGKGKKNKNRVASPVVIDRQEGISMYNNSFAFCITEITGIPEKLFNNIDYIIQTVGGNEWHKPYIGVLRHHSYDMIFFSFGDNALEITDKTPISYWKFNQMPIGKCIIMCTTSDNELKCVVGQMGENFQVHVIYDPEPTREIRKIHQIGYFISTFVEPISVAEPVDDDIDDA